MNSLIVNRVIFLTHTFTQELVQLSRDSWFLLLKHFGQPPTIILSWVKSLESSQIKRAVCLTCAQATELHKTCAVTRVFM